MSLTCGHNNSYTRPWSDNEECLVCGETTYETTEERRDRLKRYAAELREEIVKKESEALQAECETLEISLGRRESDDDGAGW